MTIAAHPLQWPTGWPRTPATKRKNSSAFQTSFDRAREHLQAQLRLLHANNVVVSSMLPVRRDGQMFSGDARSQLDDPGVAVYFVMRGKQMVLARDLYSTVHDNLRSVGLAVEHLRGLERHGGAPMLERAFEGFVQIGASGGAGVPTCWEILDVKPGAGRDTIMEKFRAAAKDAHPDLGGTTDKWNRLVKARDEALRA